MFSRRSLHIALLVWGCIFSVMTALCMGLSKNFDREKRVRMLHLQITTAVLLGSDALAWAFRGVPGVLGYYMVRISNAIVFLTSDLVAILFHSYLCCYLFLQREERRKNKRVWAVYIIGTLAMVLVLISQSTHLYYYIDAENVYHRNVWHPIAVILPMLGMLLDLTLLVQYRKRLSKGMLASMSLYIALPLAGTIVLIFYYGISLVNLAISISVILMFIVAMIEQNQILASKEKEAAELRIAILLSQIAPHFIFNTLSAISGLCDTDPVAAKETVEVFSDYLRGNLDSLSEKEPVPFEREFQHVCSYLDIEKRRFGDRIKVKYDIQYEDFLIPALTVQPIAENAVKHGLCKKKGGGTVTIATRKKGETVVITITDDGVGFSPHTESKEEGVHVGLENVSTRLKGMCDGRLEIQSKEGEGTRVCITIPQKME